MAREYIPAKVRGEVQLLTEGHCAECKRPLHETGFHVDHVYPVALGGSSKAGNLQALCPDCNRAKGAKPPARNPSSRPAVPEVPKDLPPLRAWQRVASQVFASHTDDSFTLVACPGAGKTFATAYMVAKWMRENDVRQLIVVAPSVHLKRQWRDIFHMFGIELYSSVSNANPAMARRGHGACLTYSQLTHSSTPWAQLTGQEDTVVIFDEIHHTGDQTKWGSAVEEAFGEAKLKMCLSGTPFRSDRRTIPFIRFDDEGFCQADYTYGYSQGVADSVCRPVCFEAKHGEVEFEIKDKDAQLFSPLFHTSFHDVLTDDAAALRLKAAVTPADHGTEGLLEEMLREAHAELKQMQLLRPGTAGLVIALGEKEAKRLKLFLESMGAKVEIVISEDDRAAEKLIAVQNSDHDWIVSIRMISEGVDIPRLGLLAYACNIRQELFFRQAVGRVVRKTDQDPAGFHAKIFIPADPDLLRMAHEIEEEVRMSAEAAEAEPEAVEADEDRGERRLREINVLGGEITESHRIYLGESYTLEEFQAVEESLKAAGLAHGEEEVLYNLHKTRQTQREPEHPEEKNRRLRKDLEIQHQRLAQMIEVIRPGYDRQIAIKEVKAESRKIMGLTWGKGYDEATPEQLQRALSSHKETEKYLRKIHGDHPGFPEPSDS